MPCSHVQAFMAFSRRSLRLYEWGKRLRCSDMVNNIDPRVLVERGLCARDAGNAVAVCVHARALFVALQHVCFPADYT